MAFLILGIFSTKVIPIAMDYTIIEQNYAVLYDSEFF